MRVIGIDTSLETIGVALTVDDHLQCELIAPRENTMPRLLPTIDRLLKSAKATIRDVELFAIVIGPGLWTGLRVGVTTVKSLAHALQRPVVGVSTLDALAHNARWTDRRVYTMVDARRGKVHLAEYSCAGATPLIGDPPVVVPLAELASAIEPAALLIGELPPCDANVREALAERAVFAPPAMNRVNPAFVAEAGLRAYTQFGGDDALSLAPDYMQETGLHAR